MFVTANTITIDLPKLDLHDRKGEAVLFQRNGLLYTGFSDLVPFEDEHGKWFRITHCMEHGLIEDSESVEYALYRLSLLANESKF